MKLDFFKHERFSLRTLQVLLISDIKLIGNQVFLALGITYGVFLLPKLNKYLIMSRFVEVGYGPAAIPLPVFPFYITLFICIIFTASIFSGIYQEKQSIFYFTLPASISEKLSSKLLVSLLFFYVLAALSMVVFFFLHYFIGSRQKDVEDRTDTRLGVNSNHSSVIIDNRIGGRQPQPASLRPGGVIWVEYLVNTIGRDSFPGVLNGYSDIFPRG